MLKDDLLDPVDRLLDDPQLAVLPLKNLSGDPGQEYLADGITEELIGRLSRLHDVRVISRTSVTRFKNTQFSAPEISKMLGADALVEGSVIRDGNRIRVHAQLIRGASDEHVWSESYDRELRDLLTLESDVAQAVAERVEVTVSGAEHQQLAKVRSVSPEIYELYLKGRFALSRSKKEADVLEAIRYFEEAKVRDATFAPADVGLAIGHALLGSILVGAAPPEGERARAISAAQRALQLDPELPEAYVVLAELHQNQWHWSEAEAEYRRALVLNPNDANAHAKLALWLLCQRRTEEALNWVNRARELDPLAVSGDLVGWTLYITRRFSEADELRTASATKPDDIGVLWRLGFVLIADNQPGEAIPVLEKALRITNRSPGVVGVLAKAYALSGQRFKAIAVVDELQRRRETHYVSAAAFVNAYLGLGEIDQVFLWLEHGFKEQSNLMQWLAVDPMFDPLRSDARFVDLVRRVGLGLYCANRELPIHCLPVVQKHPSDLIFGNPTARRKQPTNVCVSNSQGPRDFSHSLRCPQHRNTFLAAKPDQTPSSSGGRCLAEQSGGFLRPRAANFPVGRQ